MSCIFCGETPEGHDGPHHIIPKVVKKAMGLTGAKARELHSSYKLPICGSCHDTLTILQTPLIMIISHLSGRGALPPKLGSTVEGIYQRLGQGLVTRADEK